MYRFRVLIVPPKTLFLSFLLLPAPILAQVPSKDNGGMIFVGMDALDPLNSRSLAVQVRDTNGVKLDKLAVVTLYRFSGEAVSSQATSTSQAVFGGLGSGSYFVDVEALGYEKVRVQAEVVTGVPQQILVVTLKEDTSGTLSVLAPDGRLLSLKAEKETNKALEEFRAHKLDDSIKHLDAAQRLAPTHPYVVYLLGLDYENKNDDLTARKYWAQALQLDPRHVASLLAYGNSLLRRGDAAGARGYLDRAVELAPNSWRAQSLLASALLQQKSYAEAVTHAERALDVGKGEDHSSGLILGQALAAQHLYEQAIAALQAYLAGKPPAPQVETAQRMIESLKKSPRDAGSPPSSNSAGSPSVAVAADLPELPLTAAALHCSRPVWTMCCPPSNPVSAAPSMRFLRKSRRT